MKVTTTTQTRTNVTVELSELDLEELVVADLVRKGIVSDEDIEKNRLTVVFAGSDAHEYRGGGVKVGIDRLRHVEHESD